MDKLIAYAPLLAQGASVTIALAVVSLVFATLLGALGAWAKLSASRPARWVAAGYTTLMRGIPDLVLLLLMYFAGQRLLNMAAPLFGKIELSQFWAGVITLSSIYGAYLTETFRGAYLDVPKGQGEAAKALGMKPFAAFRTVLLPQITRSALPGFGNVWMVLVKSTAIVSVIGLADLVGLADKAGKSTREPFLFFVAVLAVYLAITAVSELGLGWLRRRTAKGFEGAR